MITKNDTRHDEAAVAVGIITGSGPEAGLDLWQKVLAARRAQLGAAFRGDLDTPRMVVVSEPQLGLSMDLDRHRASVWASLRAACEQIAPQVDHFAIACNTLHAFAPEIERLRLPARLVSIITTACDFVRSRSLRSIALLGADPIVSLDAGSPYAELRRWTRVETPPLGALQQLIFAIKRNGATPELERELAGIVARLKSPTVLLACTELPLVAARIAEKQVIDATELLARRLAELAHTGSPQ